MDTTPSYVFVLGTGRSGTTTFARDLSACDGCSIVHEADPPLLVEVTRRLSGSMTGSEMVDLLRKTRGGERLGQERVRGESNQRLSFILPEVTKAFPKAKYIWVIRDGRDVVASTLHRGWYGPLDAFRAKREPESWSAHRITAPLVGEADENVWAAWSPFRRTCWYWSYTNRTVAREIDRLGLACLAVTLREIDANWNEITNWIDVPNKSGQRRPPANEARPRRLRGLARPQRWQEWSMRQRRVFTDVAGDVMDEHFAGWHCDECWTTPPTFRAGANRWWRRVQEAVVDGTRGIRVRTAAIGSINRE